MSWKVPLRNHRLEIVAFAIVDMVDVAFVVSHRWCLSKGYAMRAIRTSDGIRTFWLHREVVGLRPGNQFQCDHVNRDRLDNRHSNLRITTPAQNGQNLSPHRDGTSRFRGVHWEAGRHRWRARVFVDGRYVFNRSFRSEEEAAIATVKARQQHMPFSVEGAA